MSLGLHLPADKQNIPKTVEQIRQEILDRIFDHVPRRKRTCYEFLRKDTEQHLPSVPQEDKDAILKRNIPKGRKTTSCEDKTPPEWLAQVMSRMKGAGDPKLIIEKTLDLNDVDPLLNRLSIPISDVIQNDFLTLDESRMIDDDDITNQGNMGVAAYMKTSSGRSYWSFVLRGEWSNAVETNGLKQGDNISLWSFRSSEILCFALVHLTSSFCVDK
ncbi:hypothetical protein CARUB_v10011639mg [Capsella rubella]|uniref:TF-B3 domain-containing protein n=1 Tax=Capsella rubella TaxID=81985 RepID=R0IPH2_9BRAS|nr:hypothetical protein CARUB_v10011639mg [Capsella rubella]